MSLAGKKILPQREIRERYFGGSTFLALSNWSARFALLLAAHCGVEAAQTGDSHGGDGDGTGVVNDAYQPASAA